MKSVLLLAALVCQPRAPELFVVDRTATPVVVSADRPAVGALEALVELGKAMGWRVEFATRQLEADLAYVSLDLSFDRREPETVAALVAIAANADVVFDVRDGAGPGTVMHVVPGPSAESESGRQRLRRRAMEWYHAFLSDDLRLDPLVGEKAMEVHMHLGHLLLGQGQIADAIEQFRSIEQTDESHPYAPMAMLRMAQGYYDLANYPEAETWARKVSHLHPSLPETAAATVLLGRCLLAQKRYDECVAEMRAAVLPLAATPEIVDVLLVTGQAQRERERPDYVLEQMRLLAGSTNFKDLTPAQWLDYHFLLGSGAEGVGNFAEAAEALEIFLVSGTGDPRRGQALVMLGRCYLATGKFVEAATAARQGLALQGSLDRFWRKEARILQARAALALGDKTAAFDDLEREVRRDPVQSPELIVFLIQSFIDDGRYQKAIATADLLRGVTGIWGDRSRALQVEAMWKQAPRGEALQAFVAQARLLLPDVADPDLHRQVLERIGQAYGLLGDWDRAADAYRGVLR